MKLVKILGVFAFLSVAELEANHPQITSWSCQTDPPASQCYVAASGRTYYLLVYVSGACTNSYELGAGVSITADNCENDTSSQIAGSPFSAPPGFHFADYVRADGGGQTVYGSFSLYSQEDCDGVRDSGGGGIVWC
jgi:hypothetical protein